MQHKVKTHSELSREKVAQRAYQLWEAAGHPTGQDLEHWLQAEKELLKVSGLHPAAIKGPDSDLAHANVPIRRAPTLHPSGSKKNRSNGNSESLEAGGAAHGWGQDRVRRREAFSRVVGYRISAKTKQPGDTRLSR